LFSDIGKILEFKLITDLDEVFLAIADTEATISSVGSGIVEGKTTAVYNISTKSFLFNENLNF